MTASERRMVTAHGIINRNDLKVYIGNMSSYCNVCITVEMVINDGVDKKDLENVIRKVDLCLKEKL